MTDLSTRILQAIQGDPAAIRSLAGAVARSDGASIRDILSARGIELDAAQIGAVLSQAGQAGASCTCTCT